VSDLELYKYLPNLPDAALQEFTEWCVLEQAKAAGLEFKPDQTKLKNLAPGDYLKQLIDQFMKVIAGQQSDKHNLSGLAAIVDFVALYVKFSIPKDGTEPEQAEAILAKASQHQYEQLTQIAKKHDVAL
jgi:hypothetical protein